MAAHPILSRAIAAFDRDAVRRLEVPEWGDETGPATVCASPMTLADRARVSRVQAERGSHEAMIEVLVIKARDADGKPIFTVADKPALRRDVDPDVLARVAAWVMAGDAEVGADPAGN